MMVRSGGVASEGCPLMRVDLPWTLSTRRAYPSRRPDTPAAFYRCFALLFVSRKCHLLRTEVG
jgi:hypothetical protein